MAGTTGRSWVIPKRADGSLNMADLYPVLSNPLTSNVTSSAATGSVAVSRIGGTLYCVLASNPATPTVAQIKAGQDASGAAALRSNNVAISSLGTKSFSFTGLSGSATLYVFFYHEVSPFGSAIVRTSGFSLSVTAPSFTTVPTANIARPVTSTKYINNVRALYLVDPSGATTAFDVSDVGTSGITYDSANDRLVIATDPGADVTFSIRLKATYSGGTVFSNFFNVVFTTSVQSGLDFPSQTDAPTTAFVAFQFSGANLPGIWGPANVGMTYMWKYRPRQQNGYYVTMWYSRGDGFFDQGSPTYDAYYGGHPYPYPPRGGTSNANHVWEIAGMQDGRDTLGTGTSDNDANAVSVSMGTWHTQALRITVNGNGSKTARFYFRLPAMSSSDYIEYTSATNYGGSQPRTPRITFGDSPWYNQYQHERLSGVLRHVKMFTGALSDADILKYAQDESDTTTSVDNRIWYSNVNPTPSDITDKSGAGHNPTWADSNNKASLYTTAPPTTSVTSMSLTSTVGGTLPFTFGQAFKQGDVSSSEFLTGSGQFQADIRNRWSDGSVKFAVISGIAAMSANTPYSLSILKSSLPPASGSNVSEPLAADMGAGGSKEIKVVLTGTGAGTYYPDTARTNGATAWNRTTARKVREILGPVMSEFHYYQPTADGHLTIWWYVRAYSNGSIEVETAIEQGWIKVASVANKTYTATVSIGGVTKYGPTSITHQHHARWSRRDWIGTDPQITPAHNAAYLKSTKLVPNYAAITVSATAGNDGIGMANYVQSAAPMTQGNFDFDGSGTGAHGCLGLMSEWDAAYVISGDKRAYLGMLANEQASNCVAFGGAGGSQWGFGLVCRDENTGYPISTNSYATESYSGGSASGGVVLGPTSGQVFSTDLSHSWNAGYMAYLATGRWFSLETVQFNHGANHLGVGGGSAVRLTNAPQDRGVAWFVRTMAAALAITPDNSPLRAPLITNMQNSISAWKTAEVGFNNLGIRKNPFDNVTPTWSIKYFMMYFLTQAFAWGREIAADALSAAAQTNWLDVAQFHCGFPVGLLGTTPGGHAYQHAAQYEGRAGASVGTFYSDFATLYAATGFGTPANSNLVDNYYIFASYWGNFFPAASLACDLQGIPGTYSNLVANAIAGYNRMTSAGNWATFASDMGHAPQWAVQPRASTSAQFTYLPTTAYQIASLTGTLAPTNGVSTLSAARPSYMGQNITLGDGSNGNGGNMIDYWSSGADDGSNRLYCFGGGHKDSADNGLYVYDFNGTSKPTGVTIAAGSQSTSLAPIQTAVSTYAAYTDGRPASRHTYQSCYYVDGKFYSIGGSHWNNGGYLHDVWRYQNGTWTQLTSAPGGMFLEVGGGILDPVSKKIFYACRAGGSGFRDCAFFNTVTETWSAVKSTLTGGNSTWDYINLCYDTTRSKIWVFGSACNDVLTINWTTETVTSRAAHNVGTFMSDGVVTSMYDPSRDRIWMFGGRTGSSGYANLYEVGNLGTPGSLTVTTHPLSGTIPVSNDNNGSYGRACFLNNYSAIGFVSKFDSPATVIKLP